MLVRRKFPIGLASAICGFGAVVAVAEPRPFLHAIFGFNTPKMVSGRVTLRGDALALRLRLAESDDIASALAANRLGCEFPPTADSWARRSR